METLYSMYCKTRDIRVNVPNKPIKVLVSKKYGPEVSKNGNEYLKLILEDDSGRIQAMIYDDVEKQNEIFQLNKSYIIRDATVEKTNKAFNTYGNDYQLIITRSTKIEQCDMPATRPGNFTPLKDLHGHVLDEHINIIGKVEEVGKLKAHDTRIENNTPHREVTLKDESGSVIVSLWGDKAEKDIKPGDLISISPVKLGLYKGQLSVQSRYNSLMMVNPEIPEADKLREMNVPPGTPIIISDSDSELSPIRTSKSKKRRVISSSPENSELSYYQNLSKTKMKQKQKKVKKHSRVTVEDGYDESSDEKISDVSLRDDQTQETIASDSDGSDDEESTITQRNSKRCTKRKSEEEQDSDSSSICRIVPNKARKRLFVIDSDCSSEGDEIPTDCEADSSSSSSQGTSADHDSLTDDDTDNDTDDGDNTDDFTEEDNPLDNGPTNFNENMYGKVVSFVFWTVFGDRDEVTKEQALSLQREMESKMEACISQAWNRNIQKALEKCPIFETTKKDRAEIEALKDCEVCHRTNHPWKHFVTLSGIPYDKKTMKEREDEDEEKFEYFMGKYCYSRARLYHELYHYKYKLDQECQQKINKLGNNPDNLFKNKVFLKKQYRIVTKMLEDVEMEVCEDGDSTRPGTRFKRDLFGKHGADRKW